MGMATRKLAALAIDDSERSEDRLAGVSRKIGGKYWNDMFPPP